MSPSLRCDYRKTQPNFHDFSRGLRYRITVKVYFRRSPTLYHMVSISIAMINIAVLPFLTAGNKSKCGTRRNLTPFQILRPPPCHTLTQRPLLHPAQTSCPTATRTHPLRHPSLKVARNSTTRKFSTTHKRCNSNDPMSMFERFTWELHATFPGNHQRWHHGDSAEPPEKQRADTRRNPASSRARSRAPAQ